MLMSEGNTKIGNVPNVSLPPRKSCAGCRKYCFKDCYAWKSYHQYPEVRHHWEHNYRHVKRNPRGFFEAIEQNLRRKKNWTFFRWHVGGDILNHDYFERMVVVAQHLPDKKFLVFTKQYGIINDYANENEIPPNLAVIFSSWPKRPLENPHHFPVAWMQDGTETRVTGEEIHCPGDCETCGMCWEIRKIGRDVVFDKH